uniref:General transcription factor IIE subunit 1 n=1 Tax=Homalodisca liturata TaxID=320908 RepID=A0A1B6J742_9HEMI
MSEERLVTEVPSSLKQLARLVVRGFYTIEDALIIDMLVRNPCMKEDDICELLRFERKQLRARISTLRNDKFLQVRLRMETGTDGKAQKVNYYFINYKTFVNVVKYKLDLMRKRLETEERDATSRASFKCPQCHKTFTDLEADQLFDFTTGEFRCTFCREIVEEDQSALPKKDSRLMLAKFNSQMEPLYELLRQVEGIRLAPEVLEPEPVDINTIRGLDTKKMGTGLRPPGEHWSGEATRGGGFAVQEARVDVTIGEEERSQEVAKKERPVWMVESTVIANVSQI